MSLREKLLKEHSKAYTEYLAFEIGPDQDSFDTLMKLFFGDDNQVTQRAAWLMSHCVDEFPWLIDKHLSAIIYNLDKPVHVAVKRNTLKILQFVDLPKDLLGITADICFRLLNDGKEPTAVKVFAMTVIYNIVKKYPELNEELKMSIEEQMPFASAGFKSRGRKTLIALSKM